MLPKKELNIYPKSDENLKSLIEFYFDEFNIGYDNAIEKLKNKKSFSLNQIEFILRKLSEAFIPIFKKHLTGDIQLTNLIQYGFDAVAENEIINGSQNRIKITLEFRDFIKQTEIGITN